MQTIEQEEAPRRLYPESVVIVVLQRVSVGESIASICQEAGMPSRQSWTRWVADDLTLAHNYMRAMQSGLSARFKKREAV